MRYTGLSDLNAAVDHHEETVIRLRISVVAFYINDDVFTLMSSIVKAQRKCAHVNIEVIVIDNGFREKNDLHILLEEKYPFCRVIIPTENLGYGRAHNLTLGSGCDYHLILNPDIILHKDTLANALQFMVAHPECGLLSPLARWRDGKMQFLCKRYPSLFTLLLRAFFPAMLKDFFKERLDHYNMKDTISEDAIYWNPQIVSGCFMLFRNDCLLALKGFDPRFFLYFEDTDLSLRASRYTQIVYDPNVQVIHHGGNVSKKGLKHISFFMLSMIKFFNKNGWKLI